MIKILLLILILSQVTSCKWFTTAGMTGLAWGNFKVPKGSPSFQQGFKDGCSTASYARGNVWFRTRYNYRYDPKMIADTAYRLGHSRGYSWCFMQARQKTTGPNTSPDSVLLPFGRGAAIDTTPRDLGHAWGGFFDGLGGAPLNPTGSGLDGAFSILQKGIGDDGEVGTGGSVFSPGNMIWSGENSVRFMGVW